MILDSGFLILGHPVYVGCYPTTFD